jgi:hypothetical protein
MQMGHIMSNIVKPQKSKFDLRMAWIPMDLGWGRPKRARQQLDVLLDRIQKKVIPIV